MTASLTGRIQWTLATKKWHDIDNVVVTDILLSGLIQTRGPNDGLVVSNLENFIIHVNNKLTRPQVFTTRGTRLTSCGGLKELERIANDNKC